MRMYEYFEYCTGHRNFKRNMSISTPLASISENIFQKSAAVGLVQLLFSCDYL
jgi:hypothetical protein